MKFSQINSLLIAAFKSSLNELIIFFTKVMNDSIENPWHSDELSIVQIDAGTGDVEFIITIQMQYACLEAIFPDTEHFGRRDESHLDDLFCELVNDILTSMKTTFSRLQQHLYVGIPIVYENIEFLKLMSDKLNHHYLPFSIEKYICEAIISTQELARDESPPI